MKSNRLHALESGQIPMRMVRAHQSVDPSLVIAQPSLLAAIKLCISLGGFEADKQIYGALDIDASHWTRIHRGEAHFPVDKLNALMDLCGNEAPLMWLTHSRGYDVSSLRHRETETEIALRCEREKNVQLEFKNRVLVEALHGKVSA